MQESTDSGTSPQWLMTILEDQGSQILLLVSFSLGLNEVPVIIYALERFCLLEVNQSFLELEPGSVEPDQTQTMFLKHVCIDNQSDINSNPIYHNTNTTHYWTGILNFPVQT